MIIAYSDARERLQELRGIAANTPAQVEMKPIFNNNAPAPKFENTHEPQQIQFPTSQNQVEQTNQNDKRNELNEQRLKEFQEARGNTVNGKR